MVAGVLHSMQLGDLVAEDTEAFARVVHELCNDQKLLIRYRSELRSGFEQSPLRAEADFTRKLESEYRRIFNLP